VEGVGYVEGMVGAVVDTEVGKRAVEVGFVGHMLPTVVALCLVVVVEVVGTACAGLQDRFVE
jgi:hypothetical protein